MKRYILSVSLVVVFGVCSAAPAHNDVAATTVMTGATLSGPKMSAAGTSSSAVFTATTVRDPHAYADGYAFGPIPRPHFADERNFASLLFDRLERVHTTNGNAAAYDLQAWFGPDYDRVVLKAEGDVDGGTLQDARSELLWGHAVTAFWDMQLGVRYDSGAGPDRSWLALGLQGLAPYWFEVDASAYIGDAGRSALRLNADYELLFTQKLILQPRFEASFSGKEDVARGEGAGLSALTAGLRLRYEIRREFAPYAGIVWTGQYGGSANYARAAGEPVTETRYVAGLRFWF
jgi:copper resistance protein B